ncbi:glycosyltransferase family 4 protein [Mesorhizobium sp. B2-6-4]|uniref:glycosyltransferase family 4 protein n=1 Tax=Mesorhizobium sp. B2-6-4 TaxID=2589913 RepID=UPI00112B9472|nr:glycosyltransferase family 4 protein [Mesorhizobium sp. B2-6-4]TPJ49607.1 glycosyltransferase family 4 protein [Mesorhizobium sp. B2-6-4]
MKIAQIAPLMESVPPKLYGGTERIVSYLTEELVRQGHDVTLFASGDSNTSAELVACCDTALRLNPNAHNHIPYHVMMLEQVRRRADEFDVLHFHVDVLHFPIIREFARRTVTTLHGRLDLPDLAQLYAMFHDIPLVSISNDQRRPMPPVNWLGTVYHGLPPNILRFQPKASGYLAFLGRISPEKGPEVAMEIAGRAGMPLKIAAKIDAVDQSFWSEKVEPQLLRHSKVEFIGEIDERQKAQFLGNATALLFPIDWPEPFGLVTIEAMACGTPVIAFNRGAVPEVIDDGVSGLIVEGVDEAVEAVRRVGYLDRARVRETFEKRFTVGRMCRDYMAVYRSLAAGKRRALGSQNGFAEDAAAMVLAETGPAA